VKDFGVNDDVTVAYKEIITSIIFQTYFEVPEAPKPLNAENHPLSDGGVAKWTGNGSKKIKPDKNDWYETVK
jgi:hypothetical protein